MIYETIVNLNEKSKRVNGVNNCIFIKGFRRLNKRYPEDRERMEMITNADFEDLPDETYRCEIENLNSRFVYNFGNEYLLSSLIDNIVVCNLWVANPEVFNNETILSAVEILPAYTKVQMFFQNEEMSASIEVDEIQIATMNLPELMGDDAVETIYNRAIRNLRIYGFTTMKIETKLHEEISRCFTSEIRKWLIGIGLYCDSFIKDI